MIDYQTWWLKDLSSIRPPMMRQNMGVKVCCASALLLLPPGLPGLDGDGCGDVSDGAERFLGAYTDGTVTTMLSRSVPFQLMVTNDTARD